MLARTIAIGDIHGCDTALGSLLDAVRPNQEDTLVLLGDLIDRGPDSKGVVERLTALSRTHRVVFVRGDHEELLLDAFNGSDGLRRWLRNGGIATLKSYGWARGTANRSIDSWIPPLHLEFIRRSVPYHETDDFIFAHAGFEPDVPMHEQPDLALRWRLSDGRSRPHCSGKTVVVGHNAQRSGTLLDAGFVVVLDTNCCRGGWLTALDVDSGTIWQTNQSGAIRIGSRAATKQP